MPSTSTDRINGLTTSVAVKAPCRVATTTNITLNGLQTIDGVALAADDRVLVKSQTDATANGIYTADSSNWKRAKDFDGNRDVVEGTLVLVVRGDTNGATTWQVTTAGSIAFGTTAITFGEALINSASTVSYNPGTGFTRSVQDRLRDMISAADFGAIGDNEADDTAALQAMLDSADNNSTFLLPNTGANRYRITDGLIWPDKVGVTLFAPGRKGARIVLDGGTTSTDIIARAPATSSGQDGNINDTAFIGVGFEATGASRHGINLYNMSRSLILNCHFDNLDGAAIRAVNSLSSVLTGSRINGCGDGLLNDAGVWTGLNGWNVAGNYVGTCLRRGIDIQFGMTGTAIHGNVIESCHGGGIRFQQDCHGIDVRGCYFEHNRTASEDGLSDLSNATDVEIAPSSFCSAIIVEGNYFNGSVIASDFTYPIRMGFAQKCRISHNFLNTGGKWIQFTSANNGSNTIGPLHFLNGAFVAPNLSQPTLNFSSSSLQGFVNSGNEIVGNLAEHIPANVIRGRWPYGGWSISTSGTGSAIRSGTDILGAPAIFMTRPAASTCSATQTFNIQAHLTGRLITAAIPVTAIADGTMQVAVAPNGVSPLPASLSESLVTSGRTIIYANAYVPSGATTIDITLTLTTSLASFIVGHPCLSVGALAFYSADGDQDFEADAAPTGGAWLRGDRVWNSDATAGGVIGWGCVTAGSPGTWKAMGNYAA